MNDVTGIYSEYLQYFQCHQNGRSVKVTHQYSIALIDILPLIACQHLHRTRPERERERESGQFDIEHFRKQFPSSENPYSTTLRVWSIDKDGGRGIEKYRRGNVNYGILECGDLASCVLCARDSLMGPCRVVVQEEMSSILGYCGSQYNRFNHRLITICVEN